MKSAAVFVWTGLATCGSAQTQHPNAKPQDFQPDQGTWRVAELLDQSPMQIDQTGITEGQARKDLGTPVITQSGIKGCKTGRNVVQIDTVGLLGVQHLPQQSHLGLPGDITTIFHYTCNEFWLRKDGDLVGGSGGYYFHLRKIPPPPQRPVTPRRSPVSS